MKYLGCLLCMLVVGCGPVSRTVVMQHPETKQTIACKMDGAVDWDSTTAVDSCVRAHEQAGYKLVGDSHPELRK